jgi:fatty-acyl-CoA synthase
LASALSQQGIGVGDTVAIICPNLPEHFEAHFGVPMTGAVLNSINTRLDAPAVAFILEHGEAKILITEREMSPIVKEALKLVAQPPLVIDIDDPSFVGGELLGSITYEDFIAKGDPEFAWQNPDNEWNAITLNYTSGTTGNPKGVVYHHRGAYLNAVSNALSWEMPSRSVYLWTLPMFHCNGWCFPWTVAAVTGVNVCLRHVRADKIVELIKQEKVDHFCGAPIVLSMISGLPAEQKAGIEHTVKVMTAGAPPPAAVIQSMEEMGFQVIHVYGLTETYGPCVVSEWNDEWDDRSAAEKARLKARQGVRAPMQEGLTVADPETLEPVPQDGQSMGEIFMRGNIVMKGYLKNLATTEESFAGGWFHSGDLAVWHPDGYIEIKDRSKDIIISGGENISSIEVEDVLYKHPKIQDVAVVAKHDEKWGEVPCAFIKLTSGAEMTEQEVIDYCRENMARFKVPKKVVFVDLPRTSTGKVQKFILRQWADEAN